MAGETVEETQIAIAEECRKFLESESGQYLISVMQQDVDIAKDKLLEIDPYKYDTLARLQNAIADAQRSARLAIQLQDHFANTIREGMNAAAEPIPEDPAPGAES